MRVSYKKLFKQLIDKDMKKTEFAKYVGIGQNTLAKLGKNEFVSMEVIAKICEKLECQVGDIMEFIEE